MPFLTGADLHTLSKRIKEIIFRGFPLVAAPEPQQLATQPPFQFYLCSKEHCFKFVDLFTSTSLIEVLQINDDAVKQDLEKYINGGRDLFPDEYEGGFKVWEGLIDLIDYVSKNPVLETIAHANNEVNILDLGCGSGLLSIYIAAQLRIKFPMLKFSIYLQDYNEQVIKYFTIPNVIMNDVLFPLTAAPEANEHQHLTRLVSEVRSTYNFMYGDWQQIGDELNSRAVKFDLILSAETLYSQANYDKLYRVLHTTLAPNGQVLIASKSHYFGVGGSTWSFLEHVKAKKDLFQSANADVASGLSSKIDCLEAHLVQEIDSNLLRHIIQLRWS